MTEMELKYLFDKLINYKFHIKWVYLTLGIIILGLLYSMSLLADDNEITIYPKTSDDVRDIIDTVIHEWVHFLQDNKILLESIEKYKYAIDLNPHEIEAKKIAKKNTKKCWKDIKEEKVNI